MKEQLCYIGRYFRRPAIGINRIEEYDGQYVTFKYIDKVDGKEKHETVTVEEFIRRLIRHIPDEQFRTIRHYGMYSRRSKKLSKKTIGYMAKRYKEVDSKSQEDITPSNLERGIISSGNKDPLVCTHCDNYYEYKGEVCLENGRLEIKITLTKEARNYLERVIHYRTNQQATQKREE